MDSRTHFCDTLSARSLENNLFTSISVGKHIRIYVCYTKGEKPFCKRKKSLPLFPYPKQCTHAIVYNSTNKRQKVGGLRWHKPNFVVSCIHNTNAFTILNIPSWNTQYLYLLFKFIPDLTESSFTRHDTASSGPQFSLVMCLTAVVQTGLICHSCTDLVPRKNTAQPEHRYIRSKVVGRQNKFTNFLLRGFVTFFLHCLFNYASSTSQGTNRYQTRSIC